MDENGDSKIDEISSDQNMRNNDDSSVVETVGTTSPSHASESKMGISGTLPKEGTLFETEEDIEKFGLRRSSRVPKPRAALDIDFGPERPHKKRRRNGKKPGPKPKSINGVNASKNGDGKSIAEGKLSSKGAKSSHGKTVKKAHSTPNKGKKTKPVKKLTKKEILAAKQEQGIGLQEPSLTEANWSANAPLSSTDFKNQISIISRLKSPNTKPIYYAGDVIKIMAFINKFSNYFGSDLLGLSFQDFEIGLDVYPSTSPETSKGVFSEEKGRYVFYQDYLMIREVISSQDKMNLVFITLLKLLFSDEKTYRDPLELQDISPYPKKEVQRWLNKLRTNMFDWGLPKEWRNLSSPDRTKFESKLFNSDDNKLVDPSLNEVLTPNIYQWPETMGLDKETSPILNTEMESKGILALKPKDRVVMLRALIDWCVINSSIIHNEIYKLSHFKRDPLFGVETQHAPRYFIEGPEKTLVHFKELCKLVEARYETRSKKKHYRKLLKQGKQPELQEKLNLINEIKTILKDTETTKRDEIFLSLYDKWLKLFEGEIDTNPLANPFDDLIYRLRCEEFFIGRIPRMGDFYIPRLHTYGNESKVNTFSDLRNLTDILQKFSNGVYDSYTLFENFGQNMSGKFKVLYHDTPALTRDINVGKVTPDKVYWYEVCHDTKTLKEFLELLDYKIAMPVGKSIDEKSVPAESENNAEGSEGKEPKLKKSSAKKNSNEKNEENMIINRHPLPKDVKYNISRSRLKDLRDYLSKMCYLFEAYQNMKEKYGDMIPGKRQLRKTRKLDYTDEFIENSDDEKYIESSKEVESSDDESDGTENEYEEYEEPTEEIKKVGRRPGRPRKQPRTE